SGSRANSPRPATAILRWRAGRQAARPAGAHTPGQCKPRATRGQARWSTPQRPSATILAVEEDGARAQSFLFGRCFEPDKGELEISGVAQDVHHPQQLAIAQRVL